MDIKTRIDGLTETEAKAALCGFINAYCSRCCGVLSLGGIAIVLGLWVLSIPVVFVLWVIERYIKWRNEKCG